MKRYLLLLAIALSMTVQAWAASSIITTSGSTCSPATNCLVVNLPQDKGGATLTLSGSWTSTISFEATGDGGVTWVAVNVMPLNSTTAVTSATANGTWQVNTAGFTGLRMRASAAITGSATATIVFSAASARSGGGGGGTGNASYTGTLNTVPCGTGTAHTLADCTAGALIGAATGGVQGAGTVNVAGGYYVNGSLVGGAPAFSAITPGTNTTAAMVVGAGASLATASTGTIAATSAAKLTVGHFKPTFPAIATAQTWASTATFSGTFPINFSSTGVVSIVKCGTNPGGTVVFTLTDVTTTTTLGTVSVSNSCVGTFATTGGTTQAVSADDLVTVVSGTDATASNVVIDFKDAQ